MSRKSLCFMHSLIACLRKYITTHFYTSYLLFSTRITLIGLPFLLFHTQNTTFFYTDWYLLFFSDHLLSLCINNLLFFTQFALNLVSVSTNFYTKYYIFLHKFLFLYRKSPCLLHKKGSSLLKTVCSLYNLLILTPFATEYYTFIYQFIHNFICVFIYIMLHHLLHGYTQLTTLFYTSCYHLLHTCFEKTFANPGFWRFFLFANKKKITWWLFNKSIQHQRCCWCVITYYLSFLQPLKAPWSFS